MAGHLALGVLGLAEGGTLIAGAVAAPIAVAALAPEVAPALVPAAIGLISVPLLAGGVLIGHGVQALSEIRAC